MFHVPAHKNAEHPAAQVSVPEDESRYLNRYRHCGQEWEDAWSCTCNDECPVCGAEIEPYESEDLSAE